MIRAYVCSTRQSFTSVLSATPRSAVDGADATGSTALSWAVQSCDRECVEQLLLCGSDPSIVDLAGRSPLHHAVLLRDTAIAQFLIAAKADVKSKDFDGVTALHLAACMHRDTRITKLLLSHGADIESHDTNGCRALHHAVYRRNPAILQLLLERGANINAVNTLGMTALMLGVMGNAHEALKVLLHDEALECSAKKPDGRSVLDFAAWHGDLETLSILRSSSRQMKKFNLDDSKALDIAVWRRDNSEVHALRWAMLPDKDPRLWYSAFEALWNSILEAQQRDLEEDPEVGEGFAREELKDDDDDSGIWDDAQEDLDGPLV